MLFRDLKPVNVMLDSKGYAVLTDMGLCAKYKRSIFERHLGLEPKYGESKDKKKSKSDPKTGTPNDDTSVKNSAEVDLDKDKVYPYHLTKDKFAEICSLYQNKDIKHMSLLRKKELKCVGTPGYRAPEVLAISSSSDYKKLEKLKKKKGNEDIMQRYNRSGYGYEIDYWALGVTLYYLLKANYPFRNRSKFAAFNIFAGGGIGADMKSIEIKEQKYSPVWEKEFSQDEHLRDLLRGLLEADPKKRLGHDIKLLQEHPFFVNFNYEEGKYFEDPNKKHDPETLWKHILEGKVEPVYKPKVRIHPADEKPRYNGLSEAMKQFAQENVLELFGGGENDIIDDFKKVREKHQKLFNDWDYIPNKLLEEDWSMVAEYFGSN
eukprot:snap_masked-scaffold_20-processed-gene-1.23-mRNA-1 protein AED:1.00 eAED:1.00 QI:0/0/0/0/1/1/2/0/375